jgi:hypothetical protein
MNANWLGFLTAGLSLLAGAYSFLYLRQPTSSLIALAFVGLAAYAITTSAANDAGQIIARLKGFAWTREDFCRGWLITGDTGSGKTHSGINQLLFQVFTNDPKWGGLCIDDKGVYWETLV